MINMTNFDKALVPVVVGIIVWVLNQFGVTPDMNLKDAVMAVVTSALVWFVPNKRE